MPDSGPLNRLRRELREAMSVQSGPREGGWISPGKPMHVAWRDVKKALGGEDSADRPAREDMADAVRRFLRKPQADSFNELKYVCYGVSVPLDADGVRLMDRTPLFQKLLEMVNSRQPQARQFRRCYQALLAAYFGFEHHARLSADAGQNWLQLRGFLDDRLEAVIAAAAERGRTPEWLGTLAEHRNLLTDKPCERYARAMRAGDQRELEGVCAGLEISRASWVWHEAVMAYAHQVIRADDQPFQSELPQLLAVVDGDIHGLRLPAPVARDAVALGVARYALCSDRPEQPELRDACLRRIGNPWLEQPAWDSAVKSEPARQMVESWLKRRLIKDFFELLAHDGSADVRRLNYWLKWEPQISDMWFVLGSSARRNRTPPFVALRQRMSGRDRGLMGSTDDGNNAFVMRIGPLLVIEFGQTGNACYVFDVNDFKTDLVQRNLDIRDLKQRLHARRLNHVAAWESRFDLELGISTRESSGFAARRPGLTDADVRQPSELRGLLKIFTEPQQKSPTSGTPALGLGSGVVWPAFTPPSEKHIDAGHSGTASSSDSDALPENPREISGGMLDILRVRCRRLGVNLQESARGDVRIWVHLHNPDSAPEVARLAQSLGFAFVEGRGFYADNVARMGPIERWAASVHSANPSRSSKGNATGAGDSRAGQIDILRKYCQAEGIAFEDNRVKGGALWVRVIGQPASSSLMSLLKKLEFRLSPGKGYYLNTED